MLFTKIRELISDAKSVRKEYIANITRQNYWSLLIAAILCIIIQSYNIIYFFTYGSGLVSRNNWIYFTFYITLFVTSGLLLSILPAIKKRPRILYAVQLGCVIYYLVWNGLFNTYQVISMQQNNFIVFITAVITALVILNLRLMHSLILLLASSVFICLLGYISDVINYAQTFNSLLAMFAALLIVITLFIQRVTVLNAQKSLFHMNQLLTHEKNQLDLSMKKQVLIMSEYHLFYFEWNHSRNDVLVSTHGAQQFQCPTHIPCPHEWFLEHNPIHPDDNQLLSNALMHYLSNHAPLEIELRIRNCDDSYAWYRLRLTAQYDSSNHPTSTIGSLQNIDELKQVNAQIDKRILEQLEGTQHYFTHLKATQNKVLQYHHDMRHTMKLMEQLIAQGDLDALRSHSLSANAELQLIEPKYYCDNNTINLIIGSFEQMAHDENVVLTSHVDLPQDLPFTSLALCTLFFNLLENALFAANDVPEESLRIVSIDSYINNRKLVLNVRNGYAGTVHFLDDIPTSSTPQPNHGLGIPSILNTVDSYNGMCLFKTEGQVFIAQILLPLS